MYLSKWKLRKKSGGTSSGSADQKDTKVPWKGYASLAFRWGVFVLLLYGLIVLTLYLLPWAEAFVGRMLGIGEVPGVADVVLWLFSGLFLLAWILWIEFHLAVWLKQRLRL